MCCPPTTCSRRRSPQQTQPPSTALTPQRQLPCRLFANSLITLPQTGPLFWGAPSARPCDTQKLGLRGRWLGGAGAVRPAPSPSLTPSINASLSRSTQPRFLTSALLQNTLAPGCPESKCRKRHLGARPQPTSNRCVPGLRAHSYQNGLARAPADTSRWSSSRRCAAHSACADSMPSVAYQSTVCFTPSAPAGCTFEPAPCNSRRPPSASGLPRATA